MINTDDQVESQSSPDVLAALDSLRDGIGQYPELAVAVSGGVDSMTLAAVAFQVLGQKVLLVHAMSPAVPPDATVRVKAYSERYGWPLQCVDAGEFADKRYRDNPVNRCYFCKTHLYARLIEVWDGPIASGANLDDLGDYRPGLLAASEKNVVHPLVEAGINKAMVRAIATHLELTDLAELPAQPCLSSRVETGIVIQADDLLFIHRIERYLASEFGAGDLRCRITAKGVRIEVPDSIRQLHSLKWNDVCSELERMVVADGRVFDGYTEYRRGSAFLHNLKASPG